MCYHARLRLSYLTSSSEACTAGGGITLEELSEELAGLPLPAHDAGAGPHSTLLLSSSSADGIAYGLPL